MAIFTKASENNKERKNEIQKRIGNRMKKYRAKKKLKQREIADILDLSVACVSSYENAKKTIPAYILALLAEEYNVNVETFYQIDNPIVYTDNLVKYFVSGVTSNKMYFQNTVNYMNHLGEKAVENMGFYRMFDILYVVLRNCADGVSDLSILTEQIANINRVEGDSMYMGFAFTNADKYMRELREKSQKDTDN